MKTIDNILGTLIINQVTHCYSNKVFSFICRYVNKWRTRSYCIACCNTIWTCKIEKKTFEYSWYVHNLTNNSMLQENKLQHAQTNCSCSPIEDTSFVCRDEGKTSWNSPAFLWNEGNRGSFNASWLWSLNNGRFSSLTPTCVRRERGWGRPR